MVRTVCKPGLGQPQHRVTAIRTVPESSIDCADVSMEGPATEAHLAGLTPFGGLQAQNLTITHTPKGVAGLPGREQNWKSQAGDACQCISTEGAT